MSLLLALRSHTSGAVTTTARHMLLLSLTTHVPVGVSNEGAGSADGTSAAVGVGASISARAVTSSGASTATGVGHPGSVTTTARHMLLLSLTTHVTVGASDEGDGSSAGTSTASGVGASIAARAVTSSGAATVLGFSNPSSVGTSAGIATVTGAGSMSAVFSAVGTSNGSSSVTGHWSDTSLPDDLIVELGLGGSYRAWLKNRGTTVRHWFMGDVGTIQARDEMTTDASGDGVYIGTPAKGRGMLPEYGLSTSFDGVDDKIEVNSGLSGTGGAFSLVALSRLDSSGMGTARTIKRTGTEGSGYLGVNANNQAVFGVYGGDKVTSSLTLQADRVYLIVGSYDGTNGRLFVADVETGEIAQNGPTALTFTAAHGSGLIGAGA